MKVGDRVKGMSWVAPEDRDRVRSELVEGDVVQIGDASPLLDQDIAYVWVRIADHTERMVDVHAVQRVVQGVVQGVEQPELAG